MSRVLKIGAIALVMAVAGSAATLCAVGSLADYVALGNTGCIIDDKLFYGFTEQLTGVGASTSGVGITVTPDTTAFNPGVDFTLSGFGVTSNQSLDLKVAFSVATLSGANTIEDVSLGIAGANHGGTGGVSIGENVCVGGTFAVPIAGTNCSTGNSPPNEIDLNVQNPGPPPVFFDQKFTNLTNLVSAFKDVSVSGGTDGSASLSSFSQNFSEVVPEPASIILLGSALLGLGLLRRRLT